MGLKKLTLAMIVVRDFQAMKDFYEKTLGFEPTEVSDEGQWATFKLVGGGAEFALHGGMASGASQGPSRVVPCIEVEDIRSTVRDLQDRGVEIVNEIRESIPGLFLADIKDLEGNMINLYESTAGGSHG